MTTIHGVNLAIEILNNFESDISPLGNITRILVIIKELLEELVAYSFILAMVVYLDFVLDETKSLILENIQEDIGILQVLQLFLQSFDSVAWVENIELFLALLSWLRLNHTVFVDMLLETLSNFGTRLELYSRICAHFLDYI